MLGRLDETGFFLKEVHRFQYPPSRVDGHLRWPSRRLLEGIEAGIRSAVDASAALGAPLETVGVDSWGVDYGLLDAEGRLLEEPIAYRDERTAAEMEAVFAKVPREEIFRRTGIQFLVFNTIFQLHAHVRQGLPRGARRLLMIPDLCHHHLCGSTSGEYPNASTTQLLDADRCATDYARLLEAVAAVPGFVGFVFPDHPRFLNPPSMTGELRASLAETGQEPPEDLVSLAKVVLDSLALRYASVLRTVESLTGRVV